MSVQGLDCSNHQSRIDWDAVAHAGVQFAIAKASEGVDFRDAFFFRNWSEMRRVGIARGCYHYATPDDHGPEEEARWFLQVLQDAGGLEPGDVLALDLEAGEHPDLLGWALRWLRCVGSYVGCRPLIYSGRWFLEPRGLLGNAELATYGLWLAAWGAVQPAPPPSWPFVAVWQHTSDGHVPGISGRVDVDRFNGTLEQFRAYGVPSAWPRPAEPDPEDFLDLVQQMRDRAHADLSALDRIEQEYHQLLRAAGRPG